MIYTLALLSQAFGDNLPVVSCVDKIRWAGSYDVQVVSGMVFDYNTSAWKPKTEYINQNRTIICGPAGSTKMSDMPAMSYIKLRQSNDQADSDGCTYQMADDRHIMLCLEAMEPTMVEYRVTSFNQTDCSVNEMVATSREFGTQIIGTGTFDTQTYQTRYTRMAGSSADCQLF